jgi:hypothetical protein
MLPMHRRLSTRFRVLALVWFGFGSWFAVGCSPPVEQETSDAGPGGRRQPLALSPAEEQTVGRRAYEQVMTEVGSRVLPANSPEVVRVRRIVDRLARAAEIEPLQREIMLRVRGYRFEWEVNVVRDP